MLYYVYVLKSEIDGRLYTGLTSNVMRRLREHNCGKTKSTKAHGPFKLVYSEKVGGRVEARKREQYLKSGIGREFLKQFVS